MKFEYFFFVNSKNNSLQKICLSMAGPVSYRDCAPDGIPSELDEKFYTGHDSPRHLCTIFKVTLFGHCIRSWQHQSSPALKWVSSGSRASGCCYVQLSKPGPAISDMIQQSLHFWLYYDIFRTKTKITSNHPNAILLHGIYDVSC